MLHSYTCNDLHVSFWGMTPDQDTFLRKCKRRTESIKQDDLWIDGAFMSEADMEAANFPE